MKKILCSFITSLLLLASITGVQAADSYLAINGFTFDLNENGEAVIHEYDDRATDVVIPDRLLGAPVVKIDYYAFFGDAAITSLSFENATDLKSIGDCAFYGCSALERLTLCAPLEELGFGAFQNCTSLMTLVIENGLTAISEQAFYGDTSLSSVSIPESVESIGVRAFCGCTNLSKLTIPDSVTEIAANAFAGAENLVIYCTKESYALQYAKANLFDYVITNPDSEPITYIMGDVNLDGYVTISDVTVIQRWIVDLESLSDLQIKLADVDGDGLDISDATKIQRYLAKFDDPYHIGRQVIYDKYEMPIIPS